MTATSILHDKYHFNILWISQMIWTRKPGAMIGNTSRIEMPRHIAKLGHRVRMVFGMPLNDYLRRNRSIPYSDATCLPVVRLPFFTSLTFHVGLIVALPWLLLRHYPNVIIVDHYSVLSISPLALARKLGLIRCSIVLDLRTLPVDTRGWHGWITNRRFDFSVIFATKFFDGITMITPKIRENICSRLRTSPARVGIWQSGVDKERLQAGRNRRVEFGWADKFVVMYHGTLSPNRGLQATVAAFAELKSACPDARLFLLGEGAAWNELQRLIRQMQLDEVVWLHHAVGYDEVADYVASADIGIVPLPSIDWWNTSSPLKLMEYLAASKPVIVSRIAAHTEVLQQSESAYYLEEVTAKAIAEGVRYFYLRRGELARLGSKGHEIIAQGYSWETQSKKLLDYLTTIRAGSLFNVP